MSTPNLARLASSAPPVPTAVTAPARRDLRLQVLGTFAAYSDGEKLVLQPVAEKLLAFLAVHEFGMSRGDVASALWSDVAEDRSSASLRSALWRLRRTAPELLEIEPGWVALQPHVVVDAEESAAIARQLSTRRSFPLCDSGAMALSALSTDLLPGWYDDWLTFERERWRQVRLHALERLALELSTQGYFAVAVEAALTAVAVEPLRESAHEVLIRVYLAEGNRAEARRAYLQLARLLEKELGVAPTAPLARLLAMSCPGAPSLA